MTACVDKIRTRSKVINEMMALDKVETDLELLAIKLGKLDMLLESLRLDDDKIRDSFKEFNHLLVFC